MDILHMNTKNIKKIIGGIKIKKKMFKLFKSEEEYLKNIIEDIDVNEEKYPLDFYKEYHHFKEGGETMITEKQKQLLSELDDIIIKLAGECEKDNNFNNYLGSLDIFKNDLLEASCTIIEELEDL